MSKLIQDKVYEVTGHIPKGKVATYGQIARLVGSPKAIRAIGRYMKTNKNAPHIPCHRVVGWDGKLVGYSGKGGILTKRKMLINEGVLFKGSKIDLSKSLWNK